jgi:tetratricopeptide (TPR) repeat protein
MEVVVVLLFLLILVIVVIRPFTTIVHELGHALPALVFQPKPVTMFVGSYGDTTHSFTIRVGRLTMSFKKSLLRWQLGCCNTNYLQMPKAAAILILLNGVLFSVLIATVSMYFAFQPDVHGFFKLVAVLFMGSALLDIISNLLPRKFYYQGSLHYSDGMLLLLLNRHKRIMNLAYKVAELQKKGEHTLALQHIDELLQLKDDKVKFYEFIFLVLSAQNEMQRANDILELTKDILMSSDSYLTAGIVKLRLRKFDEAIEMNSKALEINKQDPNAFNNRGFCNILMHKYSEAIPDLNNAIQINPQFAYAYNNRAYAKIKLGLLDEVLIDLEQSKKLDENNAYVYGNFGVYYLEQNKLSEALTAFHKAQSLETETNARVIEVHPYSIGDFLRLTEERIAMELGSISL